MIFCQQFFYAKRGFGNEESTRYFVEGGKEKVLRECMKNYMDNVSRIKDRRGSGGGYIPIIDPDSVEWLLAVSIECSSGDIRFSTWSDRTVFSFISDLKRETVLAMLHGETEQHLVKKGRAQEALEKIEPYRFALTQNKRLFEMTLVAGSREKRGRRFYAPIHGVLLTRTEMAVFNAIQSGAPADAAILASSLSISKATSYRALDSLRKKGLLDSSAWWKGA